jgi:DinB superfamily
MSNDSALRDHLLYVLRGGGAHINFDDLIADFPIKLINEKVEGVPYTPWQLLEHMRIAQWDILEFSRDARHVSPDFPDGYWPPNNQPGDIEKWEQSVAAFRADLQKMQNLVADPAQDLLAPLPHGSGQTLLREALLIADHNAYHLGALVVLKRALSRG